MKRIVLSWAIVLAIPVLFASAVYAQTPASDDEPLTWTELEALLDNIPTSMSPTAIAVVCLRERKRWQSFAYSKASP